MGLLSWIFPSEEDRLRKARALMAKGLHKDARAKLLHCKSAEAEVLYEQCSTAVDAEDRGSMKKQLAAQGFHGWKIEVSLKNARQRSELEALIADELARAGVDLDLPDIDEGAVKTAIARAQRKLRTKGGGAGSVKLLPIVDAARARS